MHLYWSAVTGADTYKVYRSDTSGNEVAPAIVSSLTSTDYLDQSGIASSVHYYYYKVSAVKAGVESALSLETVAIPLAAPTLTGRAGNGNVTLTWTNPALTYVYNIYRGTSSGGETLLYSGMGGNSYTDTTAVNGTQYWYQVSATRNPNESDRSTELSLTPAATLPGSPTLTAIPTATQVVLTWTPVAGATSYKVRRTTVRGNYLTPLASPTATTYTDTPTANTTYFYMVTAVIGSVEGAYSNEVTVSVPSGNALYATEDAYVEQDTPTINYGSSINLYGYTNATAARTSYIKFDLSSAGGAISTAKLHLYRGSGGGAVDTIYAVSDNSWSETSINWNNKPAMGSSLSSLTPTANGQWYDFDVSTYVQQAQLAGASAISFGFGSAVTSGPMNYCSREHAFGPQLLLTVGAPTVPTGLTAAGGTNKVTLAWNPVRGATYNIYRSGTSGGQVLGTPTYTGVTSPNYVDTTGVNNGQYYWYKVTAVNANGESALSTEAWSNPLAAPVVTARAGNKQVTLTWGSVPTAYTYNIFRGTATGTEVQIAASVGGLSYTDSGLTNSQQYWYQVSAVRSPNESSRSAEVTATPLATLPGAPVLTASPTSTQVSLLWSAISGATSYKVKRYTVSGGPYAVVTTATGTSYLDTPPVSNTNYYYVVTALIGTNESANSNEAIASIPGGNALLAVADAYVAQDAPNANYGGSTVLSLLGGSTAAKYSYFKFDLSRIGGAITSAKLHILRNSASFTGTETVYGVSDTSWLEYGLTWSNKPALGSSLASLTPTTNNTYYDYDVTSYVQSKQTAGADLISFGLGTSTAAGLVNYSSKEFPTSAPQLLLTVGAPAAPTVATAASATPAPVTGPTTTLSVLGADDGGEANLTYTWAATGTTPAVLTFAENGTNAAKNTLVTFRKIGTYTFQVTIADRLGLTATSSVSVTVNPTISISVTPGTVQLPLSTAQGYVAVEADQFGVPLVSQPPFTWSSSGVGAINSTTAIYNSGATSGTATIQAVSGVLTGTASVTVQHMVPEIVVAATATPNPVGVGGSTMLGVVVNSDLGPTALTYTWAAVGAPPAPVTFSSNGSSSAKYISATFSQAGTYLLQVTALDSAGLSATSTVSVSVVTVSAPSSINAIPGDHVVLVTWPSVPGATGYTVYHVSGSTYTPVGWLGAGSTAFADTAITNGTNYTYVVTALTDTLESGYSVSSASVTPQVQPGSWSIVYTASTGTASTPVETAQISVSASSASGHAAADARVVGPVSGAGVTAQAEATRAGTWTATWTPNSSGLWPTLLVLKHDQTAMYVANVVGVNGVAAVTSLDGSINVNASYPIVDTSTFIGPPMDETWNIADLTRPIQTKTRNQDIPTSVNASNGTMIGWRRTVSQNTTAFTYYTQSYLQSHFTTPGVIVIQVPVASVDVTSSVNVTAASDASASASASASSLDTVSGR